MKTTIYYFSGTGNSLKTAKDLAAKLGNTELINIAAEDIQITRSDSDNIGIVFPVYMYGLPRIVSKFVKNLKIANSKYIFAIATNGGTAAGSLIMLQRKLAANGLKLSAGFSVILPSNFFIKFENSAEDRVNLIGLSDKKITEISDAVKLQKDGFIEKGSARQRILLTGFLHRLLSLLIPKMDYAFWADSNCSSCEICRRICPVHNISMRGEKPKWSHHCEQCFACINLCPKQAIQYKKLSVGKTRYRNPYISEQELIKSHT